MAPPLLYACGSNASGQLAIQTTEDTHTFTLTSFHPSLTEILEGSEILDVVSSSTHALLLLRTHQTLPDQCGLDARDILLGAGTNTMGQLGPKCALWEGARAETRWKVVDLLGPTGRTHDEWQPVKMTATWTTTFVVYQRRSGSGTATAPGNGLAKEPEEIILSCGSNDFGELGRPDSHQHSHVHRHIAVSTASQNPTEVDVGLGSEEKVELIRGGQRHVLVIISDAAGQQRVVGWGASRKGELDYASSCSDRINNGNATANGKGKGKQIDSSPFSPPTAIQLPLSPQRRITDIALGSSHSIALLSDGTLLAWGSDAKGQITGLHEVKNAIGISATWGGSYVLVDETATMREGKRYIASQGASSHAQLLRDQGSDGKGMPFPKESTTRTIAAGSEHLIVHASVDEGLSRDVLWVGGWNEHGNLGLGDTRDRDRLTKVDLMGVAGDGYGERGVRIRGIWGGCAASWIWLDVSE